MEHPAIIALVGKGGVGKTSLSALMVRLLATHYPQSRILAIDADPAVGLATALGIDVSSTVDDIRKAFVQTAEKGDARAAIEMLGDAHYQMMDAMVEHDNISFLAIGRPEAAGCYCKVNAYLKEVISRLAEHFDYVVIDGEAGLEQINRRVMEKVTHLVLVSDGSRKGLQVVQTIYRLARDMVLFRRAGLILNRIPEHMPALPSDLDLPDLLSRIPEDHQMCYNDIMGSSVFSIDSYSPVVLGAREALHKLKLIERGGR